MHSLAIVIGDYPEKQFSQFDEELEVEEYDCGLVSEECKKYMLQFYEDRGEKYASFEECYADKGEDWNGGAYQKDKYGEWREYRRMNPDGRWDWYAVGGRWAGALKLKEGAKAVMPPHAYEYPRNKNEFLSADSVKYIEKVRAGGYADSARKGDIENIKELKCGAVVFGGEWYDNEDEEGYFKLIWDFVADLPDDILITCMDYHM